MFFDHTQFPKGSLEAQTAYFAYCEAYLTKAVPFYSGPISPYQRLRYFFQEEPEVNYQTHKELNEPLRELYLDGTKVYQVIDCTFPQFQEALLQGNDLYKTPGGYWGRVDRSGGKYVRRPHHQPKVLSPEEQARQEWRDHKGFTRDYRRRHRSRYGGRKKVCKQIANSSHRAWEKECLVQGRFDELTNFKNKLIFDPWDID
jgi:hypothetical protein